MSSPFLLLVEVAEETRTPLSTVRHWVASGKLASTRPGRRRLVRRTDLDAFLADKSSERRVPKDRDVHARQVPLWENAKATGGES